MARANAWGVGRAAQLPGGQVGRPTQIPGGSGNAGAGWGKARFRLHRCANSIRWIRKCGEGSHMDIRSLRLPDRLGWAWLPIALLIVSAMPSARAQDFDHTYARYREVLAAHVDGGLVDYAALKQSTAGLDGVLEALARPTAAEFDTWTEPQQIAFLLNLYNAATLKLVVDHYPVTSIRKIGGWLRGPWKQRVVRFWGATETLDHVEHEILRRRYREPRIHFALVCAARGCPALRADPYVAERLDAQLDEQGREFLGDRARNRVDAASRTLWLSPIFNWFGEDFTAGGASLSEWVRPYLPAADAAALQSGTFRVRFTDYDWSLNERSR